LSFWDFLLGNPHFSEFAIYPFTCLAHRRQHLMLRHELFKETKISSSGEAAVEDETVTISNGSTSIGRPSPRTRFKPNGARRAETYRFTIGNIQVDPCWTLRED